MSKRDLICCVSINHDPPIYTDDWGNDQCKVKEWLDKKEKELKEVRAEIEKLKEDVDKYKLEYALVGTDQTNEEL